MKKDKIMGTKKWLYWVSIGIVLIVVYKFLDNFSGIGKWIGNLFAIIAPFLAGILIAYILYIPCRKVEKILTKYTKVKHKRGISIAIVYIIAVLLIALLLEVILPMMITSVIDLVNNIQNYYNSITTNEIEANWAPFIKDNILKPVVEFVQGINFQEMLTPDKVQSYLTSAYGVVKGLLNVFISFICSIYILAERDEIVLFLNKCVKSSTNAKVYKRFNRYFTNGNEIFFRFITSQMIDAFVVAIICMIAMSIMNVKYAVFLGCFIGICNLIPYFGAIFGVITAIIITILTGGWQQALIMAIVVILLQQIDANIINPRITGSKLKISPLLVIFSVTVGGAYFGIIGMFLGVPIATLIKLMIEDFIEEKDRIEKDKELKEENINE